MTIKAESIESATSETITAAATNLTKTAWQLFYADVGVDVVALGVYVSQPQSSGTADAYILDLGYSTDAGVTITPIFENMEVATTYRSLRDIQLAIPDNAELYARTAHSAAPPENEAYTFYIYRNSAGTSPLLDAPLESYNLDETTVLGTPMVSGAWAAISAIATSKAISYLLYYPSINYNVFATSVVSTLKLGYSTDGGVTIVEIVDNIKSLRNSGEVYSYYEAFDLTLETPVPEGAFFYGYLDGGTNGLTSLSVFGGNLIQSGGSGTMKPIQDIQQFANGEPPARGELWIGAIGSDPLAAQITVYEDYEGTLPITGRLSLGDSGRPLNASGEVFTPYSDQSYSINWTDDKGVQWFTDYINVPV